MQSKRGHIEHKLCEFTYKKTCKLTYNDKKASKKIQTTL